MHTYIKKNNFSGTGTAVGMWKLKTIPTHVYIQLYQCSFLNIVLHHSMETAHEEHITSHFTETRTLIDRENEGLTRQFYLCHLKQKRKQTKVFRKK